MHGQQNIKKLTFNVLWVQEKEPRYAVSFYFKSVSKRTPSRSPSRAHMERAGATLQNLATLVTWRPVFLHPQYSSSFFVIEIW